MRRLWIPVLALSLGGLAPSPAEVAEQPSANGALQRRPMAGDSPEPGPVGRGRLPLPDQITLPRLAPEVTAQMRTELGPGWMGPTRPLPAEIAGTWAWTQAGRRVWRVTLRATGARALRVRFESFNAAGSVWLYGDDWSGQPIGPYRGGGPHRDGSFWSEFVFGATVTVEYVPDDATTASQLPFRLRSVAQIVDKRFPVPSGRSKAGGPQPRSLAGCHLDVSCYPDLQRRDRPSVARLYITKGDQTYNCTGFLINPSYDSSSRFLFLTAGHCIGTQEDAKDTSFLWNYQTEECYGNPDWNQWTAPLVFTYGATLVVSKDDWDDDFALLVLRKADVTANTGWTAEGWTTTTVRTGDRVDTVGHPDGNYKRAAFGQVVDHRWRDLSASGFKTIQWRLGTIEGGSSGSPVFRGTGENRRVVGIAVGDNASSLEKDSPWGPSCDAGLRVAFSRFDHIYETIEPYLKRESALSETDPQDAEPQGQQVVVSLGSSGETVTLVRAQDDSWWLGGALVVSGETAVLASNGNEYTLELTEDGSWEAVYSAQRVRVRLGERGYIVTLTKAEDGSYWRGSTEVLSGITTIFTPDGKRYRLFWRDGRWVGVEVSG